MQSREAQAEHAAWQPRADSAIQAMRREHAIDTGREKPVDIVGQ